MTVMRRSRVEDRATLRVVPATRSEPFEAVSTVRLSIEDRGGVDWLAEFILEPRLWESMGRPARVFIAVADDTGAFTIRGSSVGLRIVPNGEGRSSIWAPASRLGLPQAPRASVSLRATSKGGVITLAPLWPEWLRGAGDYSIPPVIRPEQTTTTETKAETLQRELRETLRKVENLLTALTAETKMKYRIGPNLSVQVDL